MGLFKSLKGFFSGFKYQINREILKNYINEVIDFSRENDLPFCDEFFLAENEKASIRLHLTLINYDAPCDAPLESEEMLNGIVIFVNNEKCYDPINDERFYSADQFIDSKLSDYPQWFILFNELAAPISLESYKI